MQIYDFARLHGRHAVNSGRTRGPPPVDSLDRNWHKHRHTHALHTRVWHVCIYNNTRRRERKKTRLLARPPALLHHKQSVNTQLCVCPFDGCMYVYGMVYECESENRDLLRRPTKRCVRCLSDMRHADSFTHPSIHTQTCSRVL